MELVPFPRRLAWAALAAASLWAAPARAEDPTGCAVRDEAEAVAEIAAGCNAGAACRCPDGAWASETCDASGMFRFCACAQGAVRLDLPSVSAPDIDWSRPRPKKPRRRPSGVGLLIGGLVTLGVGATSLGIGVQMIRDDTVVPLGIVLTATGGTAMLVGLPLSIVGLYYVATRGDARGTYNGQQPSVPLGDDGPLLELGAGPLTIAF